MDTHELVGTGTPEPTPPLNELERDYRAPVEHMSEHMLARLEENRERGGWLGTDALYLETCAIRDLQNLFARARSIDPTQGETAWLLAADIANRAMMLAEMASGPKLERRTARTPWHDKPIICLDFDGVLHSYSSGWKGAATIPDPPVEGALDALLEYIEVFTVYIFSSRSHQDGGIEAMQAWLISHGLDAEVVYQRIQWPTVKPPALVTLDDRAVTFLGSFPSAAELRTFQPWNRRQPIAEDTAETTPPEPGAEVVHLNNFQPGPDDPHKAAYVTCKGCGYVHVAVYPVVDDEQELLDAMECPECLERGAHIVWNRHALSGFTKPEVMREGLMVVEPPKALDWNQMVLFRRPCGTRLYVDGPALEVMAAHRQIKPGTARAGGILLGHVVEDDGPNTRVVIDMVTTPMAGDVATLTNFHRAKEPHQRAIHEANAESGGTVNYLGEWHTHADSPAFIPSRDIDEMLRLYREVQRGPDLTPLFFLRITPDNIGAFEVRDGEVHELEPWIPEMQP